MQDKSKNKNTINDLTLEELIPLIFKEVPKLETELDIWKVIEALGAVVWRTEHDEADGRPSGINYDFNSMTRRFSNLLVQKLKTDYSVIPPWEVPLMEFGHAYERPLAPKGKIYYWDWYDQMKSEYFKEEYNNIICSACALHEKDGVDKMYISIPCSVFNGSLYRLTFPWECGMLHRSCGWTMDRLLSEIKNKGGEDSVKRFKQKLRLLQEQDR